MAESVANFFDQVKNRRTIDRVFDSGVKIFQTVSLQKGKLEGKVFVMTGTLESMPRSAAKKIIESSGGTVTGVVSRNTDFLVVGRSPGSKFDKARALGVEIVDEETLKKMTIDD